MKKNIKGQRKREEIKKKEFLSHRSLFKFFFFAVCACALTLSISTLGFLTTKFDLLPISFREIASPNFMVT
jgi:hypothetical protein